MDLNRMMNSNSSGNNKEFIILGILLLVVIIGLLGFLFLNKGEEAVEPDDEIIVNEVQENTISDVVEPEEEIIQDDVVTVYTVQVDNIRNLATKYEFDVYIGQGEQAKKVVVTAGLNTYFIDLENKKGLNSTDINIGDFLILYGVGNYNTGKLNAKLIGVGRDTSYRYGVVSKVDGDFSSGGFYLSLDKTGDKLLVKSDCTVLDGILGGSYSGLSLLEVGTKVLYKYYPDYEITDSGNIYNCSEIIIIRSQDI